MTPATAVPPPPPALPSNEHVLWRLLKNRWFIVALAGALLIARKPWTFRVPQLWAEDGIFLQQAFEHGPRAFLHELAGYSQLMPRVIAALAWRVDPLYIPHVYVGAALLMTLYTVAQALSPRSPLQAPALCALAVVLAPDAGEVLLNASNIQWVFAGAFVLLLLSSEARTPLQHGHDFVAAVVLGLTGPVCLVLAPLFLWRAWDRRTWQSATLAALVALCAVIQGISILAHPQSTPPGGHFDLLAAVSFAGIRVGGLLFGSFAKGLAPTLTGVLMTMATLGVVAYAAAYRGPRQKERVLLAVSFVLLLLAAVARCWHSMVVLCLPGAASRYIYPLQVIGTWLMLFLLAHQRRVIRVGAFVFLGLAIAASISNLYFPPLPDMGWPNYAAKLRAGEAVLVKINPGFEFPYPARPRR